MFVLIYGRINCPFCIRAKNLAEKLRNKKNNFNFEYIDITEKNLSKEYLSKKAGKKIDTIPQIFVDDIHIGGYVDFKKYMKK